LKRGNILFLGCGCDLRVRLGFLSFVLRDSRGGFGGRGGRGRGGFRGGRGRGGGRGFFGFLRDFSFLQILIVVSLIVRCPRGFR